MDEDALGRQAIAARIPARVLVHNDQNQRNLCGNRKHCHRIHLVGLDMGWLNRRRLRNRLEEAQLQLQVSALEALDISGAFVDPADALRDPKTGEVWTQIGGQQADCSTGPLFLTEQDLTNARCSARLLAMTNEWAINGHENRVNYVIGTGHSYTAVSKEKDDVSEEQLKEVQDVIDQFVISSGWHGRQQETWLRLDRDGEAFIRFFRLDTDDPQMRFVEPGDVTRPPNDNNPDHSWGIVTDPKDVENVLGYLIAGEDEVPADEIQHRKRGVDSNVKRGVPLFFPVEKNLRRAGRLLRNMSVVAEIQTAIAMIRKQGASSSATVQSFVDGKADATATNDVTGKTTNFQKFNPGTILDVSGGTEYEFPASGINATQYVAVLQSELRAIAARLVMPEFMLTSDASNANFASTMVAEGPAVKMFQRLQWSTIEADKEIIWMVLNGAGESGRLSAEVLDRVKIDVEPPRLESRNRKEEVDADVALIVAKVMSRKTGAVRQDLDPEVEAAQIEAEREEMDPFAGLDPFGRRPVPGGDNEPEGDG